MKAFETPQEGISRRCAAGGGGRREGRTPPRGRSRPDRGESGDPAGVDRRGTPSVGVAGRGVVVWVRNGIALVVDSGVGPIEHRIAMAVAAAGTGAGADGDVRQSLAGVAGVGAR